MFLAEISVMHRARIFGRIFTMKKSIFIFSASAGLCAFANPTGNEWQNNQLLSAGNGGKKKVAKMTSRLLKGK